MGRHSESVIGTAAPIAVHLMYALLIGAGAGTHAATWGMYKDSPHEGFSWAKYLRSILLGALIGVALAPIIDLDLYRPAGMVVFFGMVYALERITMELWKGFLREEEQSKYFIPMQFAVGGKPIKERRIRWPAGLAVLLLLALSVWAVRSYQQTGPEVPPWLVLVTIGSLWGWLTALGGAWKDAPVEGFETLKFFRSPGVTLFWAVLLAFFTDHWLYIGIAAAGYSVTTIETYKTFFSGSKSPGKFAGKPIVAPEMLARRRFFVPAFIAVWLLIVVGYAVAFMQPKEGMLAGSRAANDHTFLFDT